jgi:RNA polymerase sigma-70 factor, ECF subfamily
MLKSPLTEQDFVQLLQDGKPEQFAQLYDAFSSSLYGIIKKIIPDEEQAADVLQDSFIKIWNKRDTYDSSKGSIFTWMLNITRNTAIDFTRSKYFISKSKIHKLDDNVSILSKIEDNPTNTDVLGMNEAMSALPSEQRQILDLMYFNGLSQDEISTEYNIPLGTVKTRARSAMTKLKTYFNR